jgi:hypothetical protein
MLRIGDAPSRGINSRTIGGVWVHTGYRTGTYAQGCLTISPTHWSDFISNFNLGDRGTIKVGP